MGNPVFDLIIAILVLVACVWWWFKAKEATTKKYVLLLGICWAVTVISYIIGDSFDIAPLMGVCILAFICVIYFYIKAILSQRKAKKKSADD
jgi:membrane protein CcdC involved in cytochrome C biogenesis